eukprot:Tbor_TRINITY_DN6148_c1_g2::TRINITY_DN6148_c1_g2_i1::g.22692::m.22692
MSLTKSYLNKALPTLCAVFDDMKTWLEIVEPNIDKGLFSKVMVGSCPADFVPSEAVSGTDSVVMLVGGNYSNEVIRKLSIAEESRGKIVWIHSHLTGLDKYRLPTLVDVLCKDGENNFSKRDIPISNARGIFSNALGEHVILSCLYFNRKLWQLSQNKKDRVWDRWSNREMSTQKMGIIGYGEIGQVCGKMIRTLGMEVVGVRHSRTNNPDGDVDKHGIRVVSGQDHFERVIKSCDFILNVMPATGSNTNMFNKDVFSMMKREAVFINIGRGVTVEENDLCDALENGIIAGAALDVFQKEPLPYESRLYTIGDDKLLLTPHNADVTDTCFQDSAKFFSNAANNFIKEGTLPEYLIDPRKGY